MRRKDPTIKFLESLENSNHRLIGIIHKLTADNMRLRAKNAELAAAAASVIAQERGMCGHC